MGTDAANHTKIKLATLNIENVTSNYAYLQDLLKFCDIVCIQEHWLHRFEVGVLEKIIPDHHFAIKCYDDTNHISNSHRPARGRAGIATIWNKKLSHCMEELPDGSTRVQVCQLHTQNGFVTIINTYMPTEGTHDSENTYDDVLDEVHDIMQKYKSSSSIIWAGDLNGSLRRPSPTTNDRKLRKFFREEKLESKITLEETPTYYHFNRRSTSQIDHIAQLQRDENKLTEVRVDQRNHVNTSSHDAVMANLTVIPKKWPKKKATVMVKTKPNWKKVDLNRYKEVTGLRLKNLIASDGLTLPTEVVAECTNHILTTSAELCGAGKKKQQSKRDRGKRPWLPSFKPIIRLMKQSRWKAENSRSIQDREKFKHEYRNAKKGLRSAQRQATALKRREYHQEIMNAYQGDRNTFFKIVKRQREAGKNTEANVNFKEETEQLEGWATYFEELATPQNQPHYDEKYKSARMLKFLLLQEQTSQEATQPRPSKDSISKHIRSLKMNKAADVYGVTAEHLRHAAEEIADVLQYITRKSLNVQKLPNNFKVGKIVPVHKKGKPALDPNSYRRITVSSIVGKIVEKEITQRSRPTLMRKQEELQFGFTENCSPSNCALVLTEAMTEAKENGQELYITFMDAKKAFDVVWHESSLLNLHKEGIEGSLWGIFVDMYRSITSKVCLHGELSRQIKEKQGIRQGAETSTDIFKARVNPLINSIAHHPDSFRIGCIRVGAPTCADDTCILTTSHLGAQTALYLAESDARKERYEFSNNKTKVVLYNRHPRRSPAELDETSPLLLNNTIINYSSQETHLGIERTDTGKTTPTVKERVQKARRMAYAMMGAGMYGLNGVGAEISTAMLNTYIIPALLYGLETLRLTPGDYKELTIFLQNLLRNILHLPKSTATPALYILTGILPVEAMHHKNILGLFGNIIRRENSIERSIVSRQLVMKDMDSGSWVTLVRELLHKYHLPSAFHLIENIPSKEEWKRSVKMAISNYWTSALKEEAKRKSTLQHLNAETFTVGRVHPIWQNITNAHEVTQVTTKERMLIQRYGVSSSYLSGSHKSEICPLCNTGCETLTHLLLHCTALEEARRNQLEEIKFITQDFINTENEVELLQVILDHSAYNIPCNIGHRLEIITRRFCHKIHVHRSHLIPSKNHHLSPYTTGGVGVAQTGSTDSGSST